MKSLRVPISAHSASGLRAVLVLVLVLLLVPATAAQSDDEQVMELGRQATDWFYAGELQQVLDLGLTDAMREAMPDLEAWQRVHEQVTSQLGEEIQVVDEEVRQVQGMNVYLRTVHFAQTGDRPIIVQWAFDSGGQIAGFHVTPQQQ